MTLPASMHDDLTRYLAYRGAIDWRPTTVKTVRSSLTRLIAFLERRGRSTWVHTSAEDFDAYLLYLHALGRSRGTRDHVVWDLRGFCAWLHRHDLMPRDVSLALTPMDDDERALAPAPLTLAQVRQIFAAIGEATPTALRDRLLMDLLYSAGLRAGEAVALNLDDLDLESGLLHIRASKTGVPRTLPIGAGLMASAESYLALRREFLRGPDLGALLLGIHGRRIHPLLPGRMGAARGQQLGFHLHPHRLRHAIACHLHAEGVALRAIQALLGHSDLSTTFSVYIRLHDQRLRSEYDAAMPPLLADDGAMDCTAPEAEPR